MRTLNFASIASTTLATSQTNGAVFPCDSMVRGSAQGVVTGGTGIVGVLKMQVSNDKMPPGTNVSGFVPTNWSDLPGANVTISGNGAPGLIPFQELAYEWGRLVWTWSAGTAGTVKANAVLLGWGA